jgi:hypothetical protein
LNSPEAKRKECVHSLPSLGCSSEKEEEMLPVVCKGSPYGFVTALLRQIYVFCNIHKGIQDKVNYFMSYNGRYKFLEVKDNITKIYQGIYLP